MPVETLQEYEEAAPTGEVLPFVGPQQPPRDYAAGIEEAYQRGLASGVEMRDREWRVAWEQRPKREPLAVALIPVIETLARILGVRAMLACALLGVFVLASRAMTSPSPMALTLVAMFGLLTMAPLAWLATRRAG